MNHLFTKFDIKLDIVPQLHDFIDSVTVWDHPDPMVSFYRGQLPPELVKSSEVLVKLGKIYNNNPVLVLKMPAWSIATPHKDTYRSSSINFLLSENSDSDSFFLDQKLRIAQYSIVPIDYTPYSCCLLNVSQEHCVVNKSSDRYVLSVTPNMNYEHSKEWIMSNFKDQ